MPSDTGLATITSRTGFAVSEVKITELKEPSPKPAITQPSSW